MKRNAIESGKNTFHKESSTHNNYSDISNGYQSTDFCRISYPK